MPHQEPISARRWSRRRFLRWMLAAGLTTAAAGTAGVGYVFAVEPEWLAVERVTVPVPGLPPALSGLTIAQLSDLHRGPYTGQHQIRAAVQAVNALAPDLIALTGDYVFQSADYAPSCAAELAALRAPLGRFAVPGNHDYWTDIDVVTAALQGAGLTLLRNQAWRLEVNGLPLWVVGVDDVWERHQDLAAALAPVPLDEAVLLLVHEPDFADQVALAPHRILLQLSGHSHGGQVNLPLLGPPVLPWLGRRYPAGLYTLPGAAMRLYTNRGIGVITPPLRFNCRPEVTLLTLLPTAPANWPLGRNLV